MYSHKFINGNFKMIWISLDGRTGSFIDIISTYKIEQTFLIAYMSEIK